MKTWKIKIIGKTFIYWYFTSLSRLFFYSWSETPFDSRRFAVQSSCFIYSAKFNVAFRTILVFFPIFELGRRLKSFLSWARAYYIFKTLVHLAHSFYNFVLTRSPLLRVTNKKIKQTTPFSIITKFQKKVQKQQPLTWIPKDHHYHNY